MEQEAKGFRDYLDSFRRRRKQLLWTMAVILALSISVAFGLPPVYRSINIRIFVLGFALAFA